LELGDKIVEELDLQVSVNTLGRWMAHHVAELIDEVRNAPPASRQEKGEACRRAILEFWEHLHVLPSGSRPFSELEPVMRAIEALDPNNSAPRYYPSAWPVQGQEEGEASQWLQVAKKIDECAKILIGFSLNQAAKEAVDKSREWVSLAESAGADSGIPGIVLRFVSDPAYESEGSDEVDEVVRIRSERLRRLREFASLAAAVAAELDDELLRQVDGDQEL
jgi:hypothetical protein